MLNVRRRVIGKRRSPQSPPSLRGLSRPALIAYVSNEGMKEAIERLADVVGPIKDLYMRDFTHRQTMGCVNAV